MYEDEWDLIEACIDYPPDPEAWSELYSRYKGVLTATVIKFARVNPDGIQDIMQDVFTSLAAGGLKAFRGKSTLKTYLCRIAINMAKNYRTARFRNVETPSENIEELRTYDPGADAHDDSGEISGALVDALMELPHWEDRVIIVRKYFYGMTLEEIAGLLNMNPNTVASRLRRSKIKLKKIFKNLF